jgi:hypothetical protein
LKKLKIFSEAFLGGMTKAKTPNSTLTATASFV